MKHMFSHKRLIGRDEKARFQSNKDVSEIDKLREYMLEEMKIMQKKKD
jgi:hypothetical protein